MTEIPFSTQGSTADRLGVTIFFAATLHALIILGVSFEPEESEAQNIPLSLEITLVHSSSENEPEEADYLAQANLAGGGNMDDDVLPSTPAFNLQSQNERGSAEQNIPLAAPDAQPLRKEITVLTADVPSRTKLYQPDDSPRQEIPETQVASERLSYSRAISRISANIERRRQNYVQRKRIKTLTARTKEYRYATYMDSWRQKVERVGNLNYPDEARHRGLSGYVTLSVEIHADGTVEKAEILDSSGHRVLDNSALRIVELAAPFDPFSMQMRAETDLLRIVRVWQFQDDHFRQRHN